MGDTLTADELRELDAMVRGIGYIKVGGQRALVTPPGFSVVAGRLLPRLMARLRAVESSYQHGYCASRNPETLGVCGVCGFLESDPLHVSEEALAAAGIKEGE